MAALLDRMPPKDSDTEVELLRAKVDDVIQKRTVSATHPIFDDDEDDSGVAGHTESEQGQRPNVVKLLERRAINVEKLALELKVEQAYSSVLEGAVRKLEKATRSVDEPPSGAREERGVREL